MNPSLDRARRELERAGYRVTTDEEKRQLQELALEQSLTPPQRLAHEQVRFAAWLYQQGQIAGYREAEQILSKISFDDLLEASDFRWWVWLLRVEAATKGESLERLDYLGVPHRLWGHRLDRGWKDDIRAWAQEYAWSDAKEDAAEEPDTTFIPVPREPRLSEISEFGNLLVDAMNRQARGYRASLSSLLRIQPVDSPGAFSISSELVDSSGRVLSSSWDPAAPVGGVMHSVAGAAFGSGPPTTPESLMESWSSTREELLRSIVVNDSMPPGLLAIVGESAVVAELAGDDEQAEDEA